LNKLIWLVISSLRITNHLNKSKCKNNLLNSYKESLVEGEAVGAILAPSLEDSKDIQEDNKDIQEDNKEEVSEDNKEALEVNNLGVLVEIQEDMGSRVDKGVLVKVIKVDKEVMEVKVGTEVKVVKEVLDRDREVKVVMEVK